MVPLTLHINTEQLVLSRGGDELLSSPSFINLEPKRPVIGSDARAQAKLKPTSTEFEFWDRFGLDPLPRRNRLASTQADLAYMHLEDVWQRAQSLAQIDPSADSHGLLVAVPGDFDNQQHSLLLGMTQRLQIPVAAMIDHALLASNHPVPGRNLYHLDLRAQRLLLRELEQGQRLTLGRCSVSPELGLNRWREAWSLVVADAFVNATRLDPLHNAAVEQQLFDRLFDWLTELEHHDAIEPELQHAGQAFRAPLSQAQVVQASAPMRQDLLEFVSSRIKAPATLQISASLASLPGALDALQRLPGMELSLVAATPAPPATLDQLSAGSEVHLLSSLPWLDQSGQASHQQALSAEQRRLPTHVLHRGIAVALPNRRVTIGSDGAADLTLAAQLGVATEHLALTPGDDDLLAIPLNGATVLLNGRLLEEDQPVTVGDRLQLGQAKLELQLIALEEQF